MSRQIDYTRKLSDEDREYLLTRGQDNLVARMDSLFADDGSDPQEPTPDPDPDPAAGGIKALEDMTIEELKELLRENDLPVGGNKDELIERLRAVE